MKNKLLFSIVFLFVLHSFTASAKTSLSLKRGTMQLGGSFTMPINFTNEGGTYVGLAISPEWDYFISRSFSFGISPSIANDSLTAGLPWTFSVAAQGKYYFDLGGAIYPYIGAGAGVGWRTQVQGVLIPITVPVGVLIALNNRVAINFGIPTEILFSKDGYLKTQLPIGYVGVRSFF